MAARKARASDSVKASPPRKPATSPYSEEWMGAFLADAFRSLDLLEACHRAEIRLTDLPDYRARDPAFNRALIDLDRAIDAAIRETIRCKAATGDGRAASLLLRRRRELDELAAAGDDSGLPDDARSDLAAGVLAAKLAAAARRDGASVWAILSYHCPVCGSRAAPPPPYPHPARPQDLPDRHPTGRDKLKLVHTNT